VNQTEAGRLAELASFDVLDTASEPAFDALVQAAAEIAECPTALVSLLDADRQWFKARVGMGADDTAREVSREIAFCDYVLRTDAALVVPDATLDARFADNPFVVELGGPRFYAGFPLRTDTGAVIGTLCVVDVDSRPAGLTARQQSMLELLSNQAMVLLELRRALRTRDAALQESALSERRYRALIEASSDVVSRHAPDGTTRYVSPSIRDVLGADPELELGVVAADRVHPQDAARMVEAVGVALAGTEASAVVRCRHADGSWRTLEIRLAPVRDDSGDVVELHSVSRDVSEQQASARRLQQLADELDEAHQEAIQRNVLISTVLDTVDVGIVACDGQGRLTLFNRATRDFHGLPADADLDPEQWADRYALYREDGSTLLAADEVPLLRALREGAVADLDIVIAPAGLPPRLVRCTGRALRDADGTLLGAVLAMADITASRAAARELAEQAEFTGVLLESAHSAMWACDLEGQLTYVNPGARQLLAWPAEASLEELVASGELAVRREAVRAYDPGGRALAPEEHPLARALVEGDVREVELVLRSGGLAPRTVLVGASAIHDADGKVRGAVATAHDVTELRASEQRFRTAFRDGPTPTARLDDDGTVREINAALRRLLAVRSLRLVGSSLID
jgi:PAS domain S-box-containing protein